MTCRGNLTCNYKNNGCNRATQTPARTVYYDRACFSIRNSFLFGKTTCSLCKFVNYYFFLQVHSKAILFHKCKFFPFQFSQINATCYGCIRSVKLTSSCKSVTTVRIKFFCQDYCDSRVAQRKRAGPITQRSVDRNHALLNMCS